MPDASPVICIVGPTASGKSDLAQALALKYDAEIVSADSMQIYKGMDIGTGKVMQEDRVCPHYGIDLVDPGESYSAALFQDYSRNCFKRIQSRGKNAILAGGTGFYIRAAIDDYEFPKGEQVSNPIRHKYEKYLMENGTLELWNLLKSVDEASAKIIHPNNTKRVVRALELYENGECYATQAANLAQLPQAIPAIFIGIEVDRDILNDRIHARVDKMRENGLVEEVEALLNCGFRNAITANQAIGYKEIVWALDGNISLDEAFEQIKTSTRRYAKRQRTWFRKDKRINWVNADVYDIDKLSQQACNIIESKIF